MWMHQDIRWWMHNNYYTYLNSDLLEAPCEYILHGLIPSLNWAPFWPHPMSMHLVATASSISCCLLQRFKFHTQRLLLSRWLLTHVQVNITTTLHDTRHTCIYVTLVLLVSRSARLMYGEYWFRLSRLAMMVIGSFASYTKTKSVESAVWCLLTRDDDVEYLNTVQDQNCSFSLLNNK